MKFEIQEFEKFPEDEFAALKSDNFSFHPFLLWEENLEDAAKEKLKQQRERKKGDYNLRLGVVHEGRLIAASMSWQASSTDLMMALSVVSPEFRGQGIYTALCKRTLEIAKREGFQSVLSNHAMTNNAILIAKLKLGFKICGLEVHPICGTLLKMIYSHNQQIADALRYRSGDVFLLNEEQIHESFGSP